MNIEKDILATLTYFNLFDYPLRKWEIYIFLGRPAKLNEFDKALTSLIKEYAVFEFGDLYSLYDNCTIVERRFKGNSKAAMMLKKAEKAASVISSFPFVEGVAVSGSLSKHFADENADIDFFIITAPDRLWIARTFLHAFKKLTYLFNMQHSYCMNYFIDEAEPVILEKNIYTATEVVTILPLRGIAIFDKFYSANNWTKHFLPNNYMHVSASKEVRRTWCTSIVEKLLDNRLGNSIDTFLMKLTAKRWHSKAKRNKKNSKGMLMGLHTGKHFSKPHPELFQKSLIQRYEKSLSEVISRYEAGSALKNKLL